MGDQRLIVSNDLGEFFHHEVKDARASLGIELSDFTEHYVVNLLCDFSKRGTKPTPGDEPLAFMYKRALESTASDRAHCYRDLGDLALYISGFFTEFIERSLVDVDYYISMGGNAYGSLSDMVGSQRNGQVFAEIFEQLAKKFGEVVDLLNEISSRSRQQSPSDTDLLRLYDRWVRTKSERVRRLLVERGMMPHDEVPGGYIQ